MTRLVFIDTETTSLRPDRRAWDVGMIVRDNGLVKDIETQMFVDTSDLDLGNADQFSLKVGHFYERHPAMLPWDAERRAGVGSERAVMETVEKLTRGAHLVGSGVSFDADTLGTRMRALGILPSWHYHVIDIGALMIGYLASLGYGDKVTPPYSTETLSDLLAIKKTPDDERHTAIGDARWAMRVYDRVMS